MSSPCTAFLSQQKEVFVIGCIAVVAIVYTVAQPLTKTSLYKLLIITLDSLAAAV